MKQPMRMAFIWTNMDVAFLDSPEGGKVTAEIERNLRKYRDSLRLQTHLRARFPLVDSHHIQAAMESVMQGLAAHEKCQIPSGCRATREAVEQASSANVAAMHASLFSRESHVLEIGAGIGSDTAALARQVRQVTAVEADPVRAAMLRYNVGLLEAINIEVIEARIEDVLDHPRVRACDSVFADPARRINGRRIHDSEDYAPPLSLLRQIVGPRSAVIKCGPADRITLDGWVHAFVATDKECRDQLVLHNMDFPEATVFHADTREIWTPPEPRSPILCNDPQFLIEPHPALIRSGQVEVYFASMGAAAVDPRIGYGWMTKEPPTSPWHQRFRILGTLPFDRKRIQKEVDRLEWGSGTEIKKRGFPLLPEEIRARLKWRGARKGVLICTRQEDRHLAIFCERI